MKTEYWAGPGHIQIDIAMVFQKALRQIKICPTIPPQTERNVSNTMQALPIPNFVAPATSLAISAITASAATIPVAENNYPPQRGIPTDDTTAKRLAAVQRDLRCAADALAQADRAPHGGFVEKALADVNQALADVDKGFDYLDSHPGENSTNAWGGNGRMPDPLRPLPNYAGGNLNGRGPGPREASCPRVIRI